MKCVPLAVSVAFGLAAFAPPAFAKTYGVDSVLIPMDTQQGTNGAGIFRAYGLVYRLLQNGVPVDWVIRIGKSYGGTDFTVSSRSFGGSEAAQSRNYAGGPFVIAPANRAAATPIINAWLQANPQMVVHEARASFDGDLARAMIAAPRLAILIDGYECIAFGYLNAAGIPDSRGLAWPSACAASYPGYSEILTEALVAGPTTTSHRDGALFGSDGVPRYCHIMAMHYPVASGVQDEVIAEIGEFLRTRNMLIAECEAARVFENKGRFLMPQGLVNGTLGSTATAVHGFSDHPVAQSVGTWTGITGSLPRWDPVNGYLGTEGSNYFRLVRQRNNSGSNFDDTVVTGYAFGDSANGRVAYIGGHQYSSDPTQNTSRGARNFVNALFYSPCTAAGDGVPDLSLTLTGPASPTGDPRMDFTLTYRNQGNGVAFATTLRASIPAGTTPSLVSGGGIVSGNEIVWDLGNVGEGQPSPAGTLTFRLTAAAEGRFTVNATGSYQRGITPASVASSVTIAYGVTAAPVVNAPIDFGATSVSGTSTEANGTIVLVMVDRGSGFQSAGTTTVAGGAWSLSGLAALSGGNLVKARATAVDKVPSADSNVVTVNMPGRTSQPSVSAPIVEGATAASGTTPDGGVVEVFVNGVSAGFAVVSGTDWTLSGLSPLAAGAQVTAIATAAPLLPSFPSQPVTVLQRTAPPTLTVPIVQGDTSVSGTTSDPGTTIEVFVGGVSVGTTTGGPSWTLTGIATLQAGDLVTARATAPGKATSDPSAPVTVLARTATPSVQGPLSPGVTAVTGTTPDGGTVQVFVNGMLVGTATVDGTSWVIVGISPLQPADSVTAVATAPGKGPSHPSAPVTVPASSQRPVVQVPLTEGDTVVVGTVSEPDGTIVEVFVNGAAVGTTSATGGAFLLQLSTPLVAGQEVRARATAPGEAPSPLSFPVIVRDVSDRPAIASPLFAGDTVVRGTSSEADATLIEVFIDQNVAGTTTVTNGAWSLTVPPLATEQVVEARATAPGEAQSPFSNAVTVAAAPSAVSDPPVLATPIQAGATSVSGTTSEADGTLIQIFVDGVPAGTVLASGGSWTVADLPALRPGQIVSATATAPGEGTSAPSLAVPVEGTTSVPTLSSPIVAGATSVTGRSSEADGTVVEVFVNGTSVGTTTVAAGAWTLAGIPELVAGDQVTARATAPGEATSPPSNTVVVAENPAAQSAVPGIAGPVLGGSTSVSGTSSEANGTLIQLLVNGIPVMTATVSGSAWTIAGLPPLAAGQVLSATATAPGKGTSAPSAPLTVAAISDAPLLGSPILAGATSVAGTSTEGAGTSIEAFVDGLPAGSATVSADGNWSAAVSTLVAGQHVTARATAPGEAPSPLSNEVTVAAGSAGLTETPAVRSPLDEGDTSVSGASGEPDGTLVAVFIDGLLAGRATAVGGSWSAVVPALRPGSSVTAVATADGKGASNPSSPVVVRARSAPPVLDAPAFAGSTQVTGRSSEPAGTVIEVFVNGALMGSTNVASDGTWTLTGIAPLVAGSTLSATATAPGKASSLPSSGVVVSPPTTDSPSLTTPILAGSTSVGGTSGEPPGTRIDLFVDGNPVGNATVAADGTWVVVGLAPLAAGSTVTATATAPGKGTSAPSAAPVVARSETPTVAGPLGEGATEVRGSSTEAAGTTITVLVDGVAAGTATVQPDGTWVATVPPLAVGSGVTAVATAPGKGPSLPTAVVTVIAKTQPPVVTGPLADGDTLVRGVSLEPNAAITVYVNGTSRGAGTAAGTGWTVTVPALVAGEVVTARAQAAGRPLSDPSNAVTVLGRTAKPTVTAPLVEGDTSLAGVTPNGGVVEIFVNGSPVGNATVSGITFSLQVAALTAGQVVTARATAAPLATSPLSDPVSVLRRSTAPVLDTPLGEGDTRVSGSSSEPDGTVVIIYVNGVPVGSATVSGGRWSGVVPPLSEGSSVTTTAQAPGTAPSRPSTAVVVLRRSESPTVDSPIPVGGTEVSGTSNEPPGTEIDVYVDGELVGTTTVGENGSWSVDVPPLGDGQEVTAVAAASGTAPSHPSSPVVVGVGMGSDGGANPPPSFIDARGGAFSCSTTAGGPAWSILLLVALAAVAVRRRLRHPAVARAWGTRWHPLG